MAKKKAVVKKKRVTTAIKEPMTKSAVISEIVDITSDLEVSRKQVGAVLEALASVIERHVKKTGAGLFNLMGLLKITVIKKPARPARKGINPFTGEETMFKARPARLAIKIRPLKKIKDMLD